MEKQYLSFQIKKAEKGEITIVASDETLDRMGEVVPISTWDLKNYKKNPVLLVDHDYRVANIVGRAKNIKVSEKEMTFSPDFHQITQLAREVSEMVLTDYAPAVSVGFLPHPPAKDGDTGHNELLEISFVAVPANPNALALAMKSVTTDQEKEVRKWLAERKQDLITEVQTLILSKQKFATEDEAKAWAKDHDFKADLIDETDDSFRLEQFEKGNCAEGTEQMIDITEGVQALVCKPTKGLSCEVAEHKSLEGRIGEMLFALTEIKEGRVLSGKNRTLITNCSTALKQAADMLDELLGATDSNVGKEADGQKGRTTKVEHEVTVPKKAKSPVARALQDINRLTRDILTDLNDQAQS